MLIHLFITILVPILAFSSSLAHHPYLTEFQRKLIEPHLLPSDYPYREAVDRIFSSKRVTLNKDTLTDAGFEIICLGGATGSFVTVARHPDVPGYVFKLYLDSEKRTKLDRPHCEWLAMRCIGAASIRKIIKKKKITHFVVPDKWIYVLPEASSYLEPIVLIATDMDLVDDLEITKMAWRTKLTPKHLDELYEILKCGCGTTELCANIPYTKHGKFAFSDTEYPKRKLHLEKVKTFISKKMQVYWDSLIK